MSPLDKDSQVATERASSINSSIDDVMSLTEAWKSGPRTDAKEYQRLLDRVGELQDAVAMFQEEVVELEALELHYEQDFVN